MVLLEPPDPRRIEINPIVRRLIREARERRGEPPLGEPDRRGAGAQKQRTAGDNLRLEGYRDEGCCLH